LAIWDFRLTSLEVFRKWSGFELTEAKTRTEASKPTMIAATTIDFLALFLLWKLLLNLENSMKQGEQKEMLGRADSENE